MSFLKTVKSPTLTLRRKNKDKEDEDSEEKQREREEKQKAKEEKKKARLAGKEEKQKEKEKEKEEKAKREEEKQKEKEKEKEEKQKEKEERKRKDSRVTFQDDSSSDKAKSPMTRERSKTAPNGINPYSPPSASAAKLIMSPSIHEVLPPMPDPIELEKMFDLLLDDIGLKGGEQRKNMQAFSRERKWMLICQNKNKALLVAEKDTSPEFFIKMMKSNPNQKDLEALRVSLTSEPVKWARAYLDGGGLQLLVKTIAEIQKKERPSDGELEIVTESIRCIKAIMNMAASTGIEQVISSPDAIQTVVKCIDIVSLKFTPVILDMLAALSLISANAHSIIVDLLRNKLLTMIVGFLKQKTIVDLQISAMALFNAIFASEHGLEIECDSLRQRLDTLAFTKVLQDLRKTRRSEGAEAAATLETQIDVYEDMNEEPPEAPIRPPQELFDALMEQLKGTRVLNQRILQNVLQHMLLVKKEGNPGLISWDLLDRFIQHLAIVQITGDKVAVGKIICQNFVHALENLTDPILPSSSSSSNSGAKPLPSIPSSSESGGPPPPPLPGSEGEAAGIDASGAPAPPPPPGGGPPPPPPLLGKIGPPPPLPGGGKSSKLPPGMKPKPTIKPSQKMKQFDWTKINPNKLKDTVWVSLDDEKINIDISEFESIFAAAPPPEKKPEEKVKPKVVAVLDTKRSQNINIMLSSFKQTFPEIKAAIMDLDEQSLTTENVMALRQFTPVSEEIELLKEHISNPYSLGKAEQFFIEIMGIPRLDIRLECWAYKRTFEPRVESLQEEINGIDMSCTSIRSSFKFLKGCQSKPS